MRRIPSILCLAALGAAAGGCTSTGPRPEAALPNRGLDSVNQPVVQRTDYVVDLPSSSEGLSAEQRGRLDAWFRSLGVGYGDRIWVDEGYGSPAARDDVARVAADYGLLLSDGAPVTPGEVQAGSVRVVVGRSTASVPDCPNWEGAGGPSSTSSNYGCAVNSNLAAMVADPSDLVRGQEGSGTDASTAGKAIRVYRSQAPTGTRGLDQSSTSGRNPK